MLSSYIDNEEADESPSLKVVTLRHNWLEWKMAMERKYNLFIENTI